MLLAVTSPFAMMGAVEAKVVTALTVRVWLPLAPSTTLPLAVTSPLAVMGAVEAKVAAALAVMVPPVAKVVAAYTVTVLLPPLVPSTELCSA